MNSSLFLQSDVSDPYLLYENMRNKNAVYWDESNKIWAIYSHKHCVEVLKNPKAQIPTINPDNIQNLNEYALDILNNLTRLSNGIQHEIGREISIMLFSKMKSVEISSVTTALIQNDLIENKIDWVNSVSKKLPILILLKSFNFNGSDSNFISKNIETIVKIMLPKKTDEEVNAINEISEDLFLRIEKHLSVLVLESSLFSIGEKHKISSDEIIKIALSNLIGLFIQSYDAGRGILSNSLLQIIHNKTFSDKTAIEKSVIETVRFDPSIHNTRRVATEDFHIGESLIKKNDLILIVLASANRDSEKFKNPAIFDIERNNNIENLTFGIGGHMCLAKYFSIQLATEALWFLFDKYKTITILENNIQYEPMINARLPKNIWLSIQ
ncbi:cytochrome P450 [Flavobacterium sp. 90]|uniref:cytochrome P450 n=1 Tax=unclassified Flavobacterium TaxID=196869 RepID=UPI000F0F20E6|nr:MULTISPECIES: cytochrome P450 [unclassified Flavobacterium]RKR11016.1 cytochrome P450 [Flavobacterium sp. 81]TCK54799.1 cytochrome P450 [Flavobacterium sp. 90]